jgi:hypothetical protein
LVILIFDLNNRNTFDNLNDYWLRFLRYDCDFQNEICVFGNYSKNTGPPLTQKDEILEMIKISNLENVNYKEIGNKGIEQLNVFLDDLMFQTYENDKKYSKTGRCKGDSLKVDKCNLY